ncbi:MAG TPA: sigma-70 family RNA polymerase sigma factor [Tepidisphaeraceae bacterium]
MLSDADREKFERQVWPHAEVVLRTARLLLRDSVAAEDLAQETLLKALRFIGRFSAGTDGRAWLLTILRNTRIDALRRTGRRAGEISLDALPVEPPARGDQAGRAPATKEEAESLLDGFSDDAMIAALRALPEEIRWTLLLVDVEGLDQREAARVLDVPPGTVKSRAHRGRAMLRIALERPAATRSAAT